MQLMIKQSLLCLSILFGLTAVANAQCTYQNSCQPDGDEFPCPNGMNNCCQIDNACNGQYSPIGAAWNYDPDFSGTGGCDMSCAGSPGQGDYTLTVEEHAVDIVPGQTTYRVYVDMVNETDFLSSVYGGEGEALNLTTTTGFFNSDFGGTTGGDINPAFLAFFPDLAADSWLSIGLDAHPVGDETSVNYVESSDQPFLACFAAGDPLSGTDVLIDDETGGAWYILPGASNGLPDENMQVIIFQITTAGELCGLVNVQVFEEGNLFEGDMRLTFDFCGTGVFNPVSDEPTGCTDETACNYDANATEEDGSCFYAEYGYDCDGICLNDMDGDGIICDEFEMPGCTDLFACNFNENATNDDGSCEYESCIGCTDVDACNFDADAVYNDGSCEYVSCAVTGCTNMNACNYNPDATLEDGSCEYSSCIGCTDADACNYDMDATTDNGSCEFPLEGYDCEGNCVLDTDGDGTCDANEIPGCTDSEAGNYDPAATDEDGSCVFSAGALDLVGVIDFTVPGGGSAGKAIHLVALEDIEDLSVYGIGVANNGGGSDGQEYTLCAGPASAGDDILIVRDAAVMGAYFANCYAEFELVCEEGTDDISQNGDDAIELFEMGVVIETFGEIDVDGTGQAWEYTDSWAFQNDEGDWTYGGVNCTDGTNNIYDSSCLYPICSPPVLGCIDTAACNYDAEADTDDGSCIFPADALDCEGNCLNDFDGDGVCNEFEVFGCTFSVACNYDLQATEDDGSCLFYCPGCTDTAACNFDADAIQDDGTCEYPVDLYGIDYVDCDNNCLLDNDGDGICDEDEIAGCIDSFACNYSVDATDQLIPCVYPEEGYSCEGVCLVDSDEDGICDPFDACPLDSENDIDGDGVCGNDEVLGCTDGEACNFNPNTTEEDFSCVFVETICGADYFDCNCECLNDNDSDGICDEVEISGCQTDSACNYNPDATDDDNSCEWTSCSGCTYLFACNYDSEAIYSDGSCEFGTCPGCTNITACNFNPTVFEDDGSCVYLDECGVCGGDGIADGACDCDGTLLADGYDCDGACLNDADGDDICDEFEIAGCTDAEAPNFNPEATDDDGSCNYPAVCNDAEACNYTAYEGYCISIEEYAVHEGMVGDSDLTGYTTYRIYALCENESDFVSAVSGDEDFATNVYTSTSFFQHPTGSVLAESSNPLIFPLIPDAEFDSWVTIGLDGPVASGSQESGVSVLEGNSPWVEPFESGGSLTINDDLGGVWYLLNGAANGVAGEDLKVLLGQFTTDGIMGGQMYVQFFENGDGVNGAFNKMIALQDACESPATATCSYPEEFLDCAGECVSDSDNDGICDELEVAGCTDEMANNYEEEATDDDGLCDYTVDPCFPDITAPYFTYIPADSTILCSQSMPTEMAEASDDCDENVQVMFVDGPIEFVFDCPPFNYLCTRTFIATDDAGNVAQTQQLIAVADTLGPEFLNLPSATLYINELEGEEVPDPFVVVQDACDSNADWFSEDELLSLDGTTAVYERTYIASDACGNLSEWQQTIEVLLLLPGCTDALACNFDESANSDDGSCVYPQDYIDCDGSCLNDEDEDGVCDEFEIEGCTESNACNFSDVATEEDGTCLQLDECGICGGEGIAEGDCDCDGNILDECGVCGGIGITPGACDCEGSLPESGYDCIGICLNDGDEDGICDEFEIAGCTESNACNYDSDATDSDDSCTFATAGYDCDGNCLVDTDGDDICDQDEVTGCQAVSACNYDETATDSGYCDYPDANYDCSGNCLNDADEDGICDEFEVEGCTDCEACNFSTDATDDDGSCGYAAAGFDCDGNCLIDSDGDGICDQNEILGCTDPNAEAFSFQPLATEDDGSCIYCNVEIQLDVVMGDYNESGNGYAGVSIIYGYPPFSYYWIRSPLVSNQTMKIYSDYRLETTLFMQ